VGTVGSSTRREKNPGVPLVEADGGKLDIRWLRFRFAANLAQRGAVVLAGKLDTPGTARSKARTPAGRPSSVNSR
jgi:hypothetical protein